MDTPPPQNEVT